MNFLEELALVRGPRSTSQRQPLQPKLIHDIRRNVPIKITKQIRLRDTMRVIEYQAIETDD